MRGSARSPMPGAWLHCTHLPCTYDTITTRLRMTSEAYPDTRLLIDNQWRDAAGGKALDVLNPATGERIGRVAHASTADLDQALEAARRGFDAWRWVPAP